MLLVIDNYDSFTYNLVQYLGELGEVVEVRRNNRVTLDEIEQLRPERIVISPGPGTPDDAGVSVGSDSAIRRKNSAAWSVPWSSGNRAGLWWTSDSCTRIDAWQSIRDLS